LCTPVVVFADEISFLEFNRPYSRAGGMVELERLLITKRPVDYLRVA